jgi:D-glycero-beta-D-manno-heptose-7-phosphate kinase
MKDYERFIKNFKAASVLVIGDVMLDKYIWGKVDRISPEAPVQVVEVEKVTHIPGGAANVANNLAALSGKVQIIGVAGEDEARYILRGELEKRNVEPILIIEDRPTIEKVRVMGHSQQLLRIDYEKRSIIDEKTRNKILVTVESLFPRIDCIVISDYGKGLISGDLMEALIPLVKAKGKKIIVDPKPRNMPHFKGVNLITPNHKEAAAFAAVEEETEEDLKKIGTKIIKQLEANCLITRGEKGMSLFETGGAISNIQTTARQVYDVTGAGDTVIATIALCLASGASYLDAAIIANHAAGVVVGKVGTATLDVDELREALERNGMFFTS